MVHACPRSLRAFALNDQQKTGPVYFNLCPHARARGERRQQQRDTTCATGWSRLGVQAAPASAVRHIRFSEMVVVREIVDPEIRGDDGARAVTDERCRHRLVARRGRAQRATGSSLQGRPNSATDMVHACPRSLRAFALNDQQKTGPVYFNLCPHARARGERRQQQGTTCSTGWRRRCEAAPASAVGDLGL